MANRNNNSRITPEETVNINLQPQAAPVDKTISYQPDLTEAKKTAATADALAKLGQGALDYDGYLRREAIDAAISAVSEVEAEGGNKKEWADVSRHVEGFAKLNPYIKDSYRTLTAQDIYRSSVLKLSSNPNLEKMESGDFNKFVNTTKTEMLTAFKESGLDPKNYASYVEKFGTDCYNMSQLYTAKNAEYTYNISLIKHSSDLGFQLGANTFIAKGASAKSQAITAALDIKIKELTDLGTPKDDIAKVVTSGIQSYIIDNADTLNSASLESAVKNIKINGQSINELVPNYAYEVHKMVNLAKRSKYEERRADYEDEQLTLKMNTDSATKDFFKWFKNNQNADPKTIQENAIGLINKYGIDENGLSFLNDDARTRGVMTSLKEVESNNEVLQEFGRKAANGTLTGQEIGEALQNKKINWQDGLQFIDRLNRETKQEVREFESVARDFDSKMKKDGIYGKSLKLTEYDSKLRNERNQITIDLNEGRITAEQAKAKIADLDRIANSIKTMRENRNKNYSLLTNANYVKNQSYPKYQFESASNAFKTLGLIRGGYGQRIKGNITSGINPNRTINGVKRPHRGYDIGANEGTPIRNCNMSGQVVASGFQDSMGNFVVVKYNNGTYARYMHLKNSTSHLQNKTLLANQQFGYVGSTGSGVTGPHLHVDFWNKNMELINVETFSKGIR
jgi:murein DD-endopeptidase MepM/ murein hydrolase activator NlpD